MTDMSPKAVTNRLRRTSQLRRLCLALGRGTREDLETLEADARGTPSRVAEEAPSFRDERDPH